MYAIRSYYVVIRYHDLDTALASIRHDGVGGHTAVARHDEAGTHADGFGDSRRTQIVTSYNFV